VYVYDLVILFVIGFRIYLRNLLKVSSFLFVFVPLVLTVNIIMLSLMTTLAPITFEDFLTNEDIFGRPTEEFRYCDYTNARPYIYAIFGVNFAMVFLAFFQAWRARNLSTEFAESRYINNALLISLVVLLCSVSVMYLTQQNPDVDTFISTVLVSVISSTVLCFIFVPKIRMHYNPTSRSMSTLSSSWRRGSNIVSSSIRNSSNIASSSFKNSSNILSSSFKNGSNIASSSFQNSGNMASSSLKNNGSIASSNLKRRSSKMGDRILTIKTQEELAREMKLLQRENDVLKKKENSLEEKLEKYKKLHPDDDVSEYDLGAGDIELEDFDSDSDDSDSDDDEPPSSSRRSSVGRRISSIFASVEMRVRSNRVSSSSLEIEALPKLEKEEK